MSPELLRRAMREAQHSRRLAQFDWARYPIDYYRPVDRQMRWWLQRP